MPGLALLAGLGLSVLRRSIGSAGSAGGTATVAVGPTATLFRESVVVPHRQRESVYSNPRTRGRSARRSWSPRDAPRRADLRGDRGPLTTPASWRTGTLIVAPRRARSRLTRCADARGRDGARPRAQPAGGDHRDAQRAGRARSRGAAARRSTDRQPRRHLRSQSDRCLPATGRRRANSSRWAAERAQQPPIVNSHVSFGVRGASPRRGRASLRSTAALALSRRRSLVATAGSGRGGSRAASRSAPRGRRRRRSRRRSRSCARRGGPSSAGRPGR